MIGYVPLPADFRHKELYLVGPPIHRKNDDFRLRHPSMDLNRRAKIFAPFDALKGFSEAIHSKEIVYEAKRELSPRAAAALERQLSALAQQTVNGRFARKNAAIVTLEYYVPCSDQNHAAYGVLGEYEYCTGHLWKIDYQKRLLFIADRAVCLDDIYSIKTTDMDDDF